jgi:microcystin-dependent protein
MTSPFLGEVQIFGFNFAPAGWALANGTTLQLRQYSALFSLLGTTYGGNGTSTFMLPNLTSRTACSQGTGPGLTQRTIGESFGEQTYALSSSEMPGHDHPAALYSGGGTKAASPLTGGALTPGQTFEMFIVPASQSNPTSLSPSAVAPFGGGLPHANEQPYLAITYAVALVGVFPAFN